MRETLSSHPLSKNYIKRGLVGAIVIAILIAVDQITKQLVVLYLKEQNPLVIIPGVFELRYLENQGAAFGIFQGRTLFFVIFTIVILAFLIYFYMVRIPNRKKYRYLQGICLLFISGAVGNLIDRIMHTFVIDFLYFSLIDFPIFNMADVYVTVAAFLLIILGLFYYKESDYVDLFPSKEK